MFAYLLYLLLGFIVPVFLLKVAMAPPRTQRAAVALGMVAAVLLLPTLAFAAPWYERDPFVVPVQTILAGAAVAAVAWLTGLFAKSQKANIANANQALAESLENQLRGLMLQAVSAVEEHAARSPLTFKSKDKRSEALDAFQRSLPQGIRIPHAKAELLLDATLALSGKFGATANKKG